MMGFQRQNNFSNLGNRTQKGVLHEVAGRPWSYLGRSSPICRFNPAEEFGGGFYRPAHPDSAAGEIKCCCFQHTSSCLDHEVEVSPGILLVEPEAADDVGQWELAGAGSQMATGLKTTLIGIVVAEVDLGEPPAVECLEDMIEAGTEIVVFGPPADLLGEMLYVDAK